MIQNIIVYIIISLTILYGVYAVFRSLTKKEKSGCDGCSGCDIKKEINHHKSGTTSINCNSKLR